MINKLNRELRMTSSFKRDVKRYKKRNKDIEKLYDVVEKIINDEKLDEKYRDHALVNSREYKNARECHIEPDWLLVYRFEDGMMVLLLLKTGTHSDLF